MSAISDDYAAVARCEGDVQHECGNHVSAACSQPYYLDVTHPDAHKGHVVAVLSQTLSIPPEQIATVGDMPNDVLMFKKSRLSVAMGNASPEVQAQARLVTTSNEEEGVRQCNGALHSWRALQIRGEVLVRAFQFSPLRAPQL